MCAFSGSEDEIPAAPEPTGRRHQWRMANVAAIRAAARVEFDAHGFEAASLRDIAVRARLSTGCIFANFADKAALYQAVIGHAPPDDTAWRSLHAALEAFHLNRDHKLSRASAAVDLAQALEALLLRPYVPGAARDRARAAEAAAAPAQDAA